jgi:uncharacterized membrane protein (DUF485 family)
MTELSAIARDVDFKPFLDAVVESSRRSRFILYLIIIDIIASFGLIQNYQPSWMSTRVLLYQHIYECWEANYAPPTCTAVRKLMEDSSIARKNGKRPSIPFALPDRIGGTDFDSNKSESIRQFREHLNALIRKRADALVVQLPILGITFDINDLGLVSGSALLILLSLFRSVQIAEADNLRRADRRAPDDHSRELILMAQVLSRPKANPRLSWVLNRITFLVPILVYGRIVCFDFRTQALGTALSSGTYTRILVMIEVVLLVAVALMSWYACSDKIKVDRVVRTIHDRVGPFPGDL